MENDWDHNVKGDAVDCNVERSYCRCFINLRVKSCVDLQMYHFV